MTRFLHLLIGTVAAAATITGAHNPANGVHKVHGLTSGTILLDRIADGHPGNATLEYEGKTHRFSIRMMGLSTAEFDARVAKGHVYHLSHLSHFSGTYGPLRPNVGTFPRPDAFLWLENGNGVVIGLQSRPGNAAPMHIRSVNIAFTH